MAASPSHDPPPTLTETDWRWQAIARRKQGATPFLYGVRTTGVYCRVGCASRLPNPGNVEIFESSAAARAAGYRACKRCKPDGERAPGATPAWVARVCLELETCTEPPSLAELAREVGLSRSHLQRVFQAATGLSPRKYAAAARARRFRDALGAGAPVTHALYSAGYGSSGTLYAESSSRLGMTPREFRDKGRHLELEYGTARCTLGVVLVAFTSRGICAILLGDSRQELVADLNRRFPKAQLRAASSERNELLQRVVLAVKEPKLAAELPLDVRGTAFQERVWQALRAIAPGTTTSYGELAERLGCPRSVRATASAIASNPAAIAIPCHRVQRADGNLAGYRWGLHRKRALLELERSPTADESKAPADKPGVSKRR